MGMKLKFIICLVFCLGVVFNLHAQILPAAFGVSTPSRPVANPIITSGLVLHLDAGNTASYPGSGITWTDLSSSGNNGTLTNGPTYSSSNGGSIVFDGSNDIVSSFSTQISGTGSKSISSWIKLNTTSRGGISGTRSLAEWGWGFTVNRSGVGTLDFYDTRGSSLSAAAGLGTNIWYHVTVTYDDSRIVTLYVNGSQVAISSTPFAALNASTFNGVIGNEDEYTNPFYHPFRGSIAQVAIYNRALTAVEITNNFNADKARYDNITIGSQVWTSKNLDVTTYRNGDPIPQVTDPTEWAGLTTGAWCYYNNDPANGAIYGKLYNWYAVNDSRGLAPAGWHIPTDAEWTTLATSLGGDNVVGGKMKMTGTTYWSSPNTGATNSSGFSGLPGGYGGESFGSFRNYGSFWTATESGVSTAWTRDLGYNYDYLYRFSLHNKRAGFSVRCIKD